MKTNEKLHLSTVIASLNKIYDQSKIYGKLNPKDIYILEAIYKLLSGCETSISNCQRKSLYSLYTKLLYNSKYICPSKPYKEYTFTNNKFIQAETTDCNTLPTQDLIYYWQEALGVTSSIILNNIETGTYLQTKPSDLKSVFVEGKDISYINIGLICFTLTNVLSTAQYHIYDDDNNADVTEGFESFYNTELKARIFISNNIYSHGIMNFKIKKI